MVTVSSKGIARTAQLFAALGFFFRFFHKSSYFFELSSGDRLILGGIYNTLFRHSFSNSSEFLVKIDEIHRKKNKTLLI